MKQQEYGMEYVSARATPELVGREDVLGLIRSAIEEKNSQTQVIYVTAWGGMGKTRLLEDVVKRWGSENSGSKSRKEDKFLIVNSPVDLYHTHTHSEEGLIAEIVDMLDPQENLFIQYAKKRAELTRMKYQKGETQPIKGLRKEMIEAFKEELNELGGKYDKIVLVFDTAEVLTYETDRVQKALGLADQPIGVARWLTQDFISQLRNAVVLIAGRPESPQLLDELKKTGAKVTKYDLPRFSEDETLEYFRVVTEVARIENPQSANRIESIPEQTRKAIHCLTDGRPFVLALLIDYLAIAKEIPSLEQRSPESFREELWDLIVETIQEGWRPLDQVVEALSWTPKGMGAELLAWVLHHREPTDDEVKEAQESIHALRQSEKRLSFVRIRGVDNLVFLQDEMYDLMEKAHMNPESALRRNKINDDILNFYNWKIRQSRRKIMERDLLIVGEITTGRLTQTKMEDIVPEDEKMRRVRARLQAYQSEQVYYNLKADVFKGIELYLQYAEESFQSRDLNLLLQLRNELLRFAVKNIPIEGITWDDIDADMGPLWVKVSLADEKYEEAESQMEHFRETCPELLQPGSYADLNLNIWETWILAYTGKNHDRSSKLLSEILEKVEGLPSKTSLDKWQISFLRVYAISMQGFLYRTQGEFKKAVEKYLQALPLWRELKLEIEASNNLNNLAWAEAEIGDFHAALTHCNDGLQMRRKMGRRNLIGLSLNTLGLIETREGSPERARFHCEQALKIFRDTEDAGGIGLSCLALAESLRRTTNMNLLTYEEVLDYLKKASQYVAEAVTIFTEQVKQPLRQVETYIEVGCVYREWVRHLPADSLGRSEMIEKSRVAYEAAVKVAMDGGYEYRAIDALVNLAWLDYYVGDVQKTEEALRTKVRDYLGDKRLFTREHGVDKSHPPISWNWVQLGKANVLLGKIYFDQYEQANRKKQKSEAEGKLRQAAHNWTLSMAYNSLYGKDFRDFAKGREDVYKCLNELNNEEMNWVVDSMNRTHQEYHIAEEQRAFEQLLKERFGLIS